ncbi:LysR substrate-binding domain-containing protein [Klebsiella variicola]|uniref:LysR substrate-binding domain-containing protein n=1 Tax=Klebsiella variicola TaxID=244366 RepID=UPI000D742547|nr:LysR substrate-binding domain-containing protein [Klebsiella variicola]HCI6063368.1 LysR family transcriptional regulator [Klebsiella variicola subsp. variicola]EIY5101851.1 LysR family transcriptional regulator [Klebsiella variicola]EIY5158023.1 LysR family transcriptional regulator [Klebsiella variicola]EKW2092673.1 LysR family transcriptional regulator [Klebsiella variicola]PXL03221.1 LysR family transcriptional regulator [Klebsiella variicola]
MDYRYLHAFVVLAGELHFGNAARRLHITQPALSRQIRVLETHLGMPLFIRDRRHVVLSTEGRRLAEAARISVSHYEKLMSRARSLREGFSGQLKLGYVGSAILDPALTCLTSGYRRIQPDVEIVIEEHNVSDQLTLLLDHELDAGLIRSPVPRYAGLNYLNLATRPLIAAVPHTHPQAAVERIALVSLAGDTFMVQQDPPGVGLGWSALHACDQARFVPQKIHYTRDVAVAIGMVSLGIGVTLVPETQRSVTLPNVCYCSLEDAGAATTLTLCWPKSRKSRELVEFVRYITPDVLAAMTPPPEAMSCAFGRFSHPGK